MNDKEEKEQGGEQGQTRFKVSDRRMFTPEGELREPVPAEEAAQERQEPQVPPAASAPPPGPRAGERSPSGARADEEVNFSSFLISLATSAMVHLGEIPDPASRRRMENLEAGKQMIDILSILQEKTRGNLDPDEAHLLENLLYELRMKYLSKAKVIKT